MKRIILIALIAFPIAGQATQDLATIRPKGNAVVRTDAPSPSGDGGAIAPPSAQGLCNAQEAITGALSNSLNYSNRGITFISGIYIGSINGIRIASGTGNFLFNLNGNNIANAAFIDYILAALAGAGGNQTNLDVAGGTNAAPTLPTFYIDFNSLSVSGVPVSYGTCTPGDGQLIISFDLLNTLNAGTIVDFTGASPILTIGVFDSPTKQQIITKLVALGGGQITDLTGLKIKIIPTDYVLEPLTFTSMTGSYLDPAFTVDFNYITISNAVGDIGDISSGHALIHFASASALAASTLTWDGSATWASIGYSDAPTKQQVINKLVTLGAGKITDLGGLKIRVVPTDGALGQFTANEMPGSGFVANNWIGQLVANGAEIGTN